jgi:hypothetical protein
MFSPLVKILSNSVTDCTLLRRGKLVATLQFLKVLRGDARNRRASVASANAFVLVESEIGQGKKS